MGRLGREKAGVQSRLALSPGWWEAGLPAGALGDSREKSRSL